MTVTLVGRERPFLEDATTAILGEGEHPEVSPALRWLVAVPDSYPHDGAGALDGNDVALDGERLIETRTLGLPELAELVQTPNR